MAYKLFVDSFDTETFSVTGGPTTLQTPRWSVFSAVGSTTVSSSSGNGRRGSRSLRFVTTVNLGHVTTSFAGSTHVVAGFWHNSSLSGGSGQIVFRNGTNTLLTFNITSTGKITCQPVFAGTTYTSANNLSSGGNYIEIGAVIGNSGSFEVRVNGTSTGWLNVSGVDTQPGTATNCDNFRIQVSGSSNLTVDIDDFYLTYGNELKWLGDIRVDALALTANSTPQDWTPDTGNAWERLNATAGYITGTTLDDESLFALADYTPQTTAIHGVQISAKARKTDAGSRSMAIEVKSGTTTDVGDTIALGDTTTEYREVWLTDPDTASAWTDGGVDALEIGVKVMD